MEQLLGIKIFGIIIMTVILTLLFTMNTYKLSGDDEDNQSARFLVSLGILLFSSVISYVLTTIF